VQPDSSQSCLYYVANVVREVVSEAA